MKTTRTIDMISITNTEKHLIEELAKDMCESNCGIHCDPLVENCIACQFAKNAILNGWRKYDAQKTVQNIR